MPSIRKSASSRQNIIPYMIRSASSKLSLAALSSTSSFGALFSSTSTSGSSRSIFTSGIRGTTNGQDKENAVPSTSTSSISGLVSKGRSRKDKSKRKGSAYPEISAPQMTAESLEAVRAKFTLVPLKKIEPSADDSDVVIVTEVDYKDMPPTVHQGNRF